MDFHLSTPIAGGVGTLLAGINLHVEVAGHATGSMLRSQLSDWARALLRANQPRAKATASSRLIERPSSQARCAISSLR